MFKLFFGYPFVFLVCFWLASDVEITTSLKAFKHSHFSIQFPKASLRAEQSEPWFEFYWPMVEQENEQKKYTIPLEDK
ncbi:MULTISPECIES: hypothetical protein [Psychromonas]|uniref:hypothetical protein n=1 Tax=Psychromonas TaxID=67572 RepID=UPI0003F7EFF8|nr:MULTISPECIES: hypothetical protein [Psychromonas]MBB1273143.1 hypothetical protein [Psychromonas sp. SR45-3]